MKTICFIIPVLFGKSENASKRKKGFPENVIDFYFTEKSYGLRHLHFFTI